MEVLCGWLNVDRKVEQDEGGRRVVKTVYGWVNDLATQAAYAKSEHGGAFNRSFEMLGI